jgi:hypothetical protein
MAVSTKCPFRRQCVFWDETTHYRCNIGEEQHQDLGHVEEYGSIPQTLAPLVTLVGYILQVFISYLSQETSCSEWGWQFFSILISPCIVIYFYSTTKKRQPLSQFIYSCKTLYMFRTVFPSIIRSLKVRIQ